MNPKKPEIKIHRAQWGFPHGTQWDIYFDYGYVRTFAEREAVTIAECFVYLKNDRSWHFPYVRTSIGEGLSDISSAYGYGGMITNVDDPEWFAEGRKAFEKWAQNEGIISEFVRWHPALNSIANSPDVPTIVDRRTISVDLRQDLNGWRAARPESFQSQLRQAIEGGIHFCELDWAADLPVFENLYRETMIRNKAPAFYFFEHSHFVALKDRLGKRCRLVGVKNSSGSVVAGSVLLFGEKWAHYHLSASDDAGRKLRANNLLLDGIVEYCAASGFERLHLGGGATADPKDGLFKFKQNVGTDLHDSLVTKYVHNPEKYAFLCDRAVRKVPELAELRGKYLQLYRHPRLTEKT
jgi:hypothetical protein